MPSITYPRLVEAVGRCSPEDVGGTLADAEISWMHSLIETMRNAGNLEWLGAHFDPSDADRPPLGQPVGSRAGRWTRRRAARKRIRV